MTTTKKPKLAKPKPSFPYKLGKLPATGKAKLRLKDYLQPHKLPMIPDDFGHELLVGDWGMLGNDQYGDCAIAGPYHALQLWNAEGANFFDISTETVLKSYGAVTGFSADDPNSDVGTNVDAMCEYWKNIGFPDDEGNIHKIDGYVALEPGDISQLWAALYLFDGMGVGIRMPEEWMQSFQLGQAWDTVANPNIVGGHYVTGVARRGGNLVVVTWGQLQQMTAAGYEQFSDESVIYVDTDKLIQGKDINGFDLESLRKDMWEVARCEAATK